ncbi:M20/M25/M40 family metallo-hydrolase [Rhodococcus hoagii]|nr:M20/M25/M40 family metallo-hydrolase [Prescottella equi]
MLGHADTVWPEGATADWPIVTNAPTMSGPGLGDMKCALAMAVHAIEAALETAVPGVASITYALVPDEELGSVDSRGWLADLGRRTDVCLALEAGLVDGGVIVSRGAVGAMIITAHGRTAHCTDDTGASALRALAPLVEELESVTDRAQRTICSVGILRSGTARQVVPIRRNSTSICGLPATRRARLWLPRSVVAPRPARWTGSGSRSPEESPVQRFRVRSPTPSTRSPRSWPPPEGRSCVPSPRWAALTPVWSENSRHWCWTGSGPPRSTSAAVPRRWCGTPSSHARRCWRHSSATRVGSPRTCRTERTIDDTRGAHTSSWCCKYDDSRWH